MRAAGARPVEPQACVPDLDRQRPRPRWSIVLRRYMPGSATAIGFNLPLGIWLLHRTIETQAVDL